MAIMLQYGSETGTPEAAASALRAAASSHGIAPKAASRVDLAAASYAAEQWCRAFRTRTLAYPAVHGQEAVRSLAAILARASGRRHGRSLMAGSLPRDDVWEALTAGLSEQDQWEVAGRAVSDLRYGGSAVLVDWVKLRLGSPTA